MPRKPFDQLTDKQKRIAVARDALKQLELKNFKPSWMYFNVINTPKYLNDHSDQLNSAVKNKQVRCEGCAKASLFLSLIMFTNHVTIREADISNGTDIVKKFSGFWDKENLDLIEIAYERNTSCNNDLRNPLSAIRFGVRYKTDRGRLVAILNNIIKNKGTFIS